MSDHVELNEQRAPLTQDIILFPDVMDSGEQDGGSIQMQRFLDDVMAEQAVAESVYGVIEPMPELRELPCLPEVVEILCEEESVELMESRRGPNNREEPQNLPDLPELVEILNDPLISAASDVRGFEFVYEEEMESRRSPNDQELVMAAESMQAERFLDDVIETIPEFWPSSPRAPRPSPASDVSGFVEVICFPELVEMPSGADASQLGLTSDVVQLVCEEVLESRSLNNDEGERELETRRETARAEQKSPQAMVKMHNLVLQMNESVRVGDVEKEDPEKVVKQHLDLMLNIIDLGPKKVALGLLDNMNREQMKETEIKVRELLSVLEEGNQQPTDNMEEFTISSRWSSELTMSEVGSEYRSDDDDERNAQEAHDAHNARNPLIYQAVDSRQVAENSRSAAFLSAVETERRLMGMDGLMMTWHREGERRNDATCNSHITPPCPCPILSTQMVSCFIKNYVLLIFKFLY